MKQRYFIKFDPKIKQLTGCDRATLILEKLECFFGKQPDGFYKFIEPCSHRLYKQNDSWAEELGCNRKCFTRSWDIIGFRHKSRRAFEEAQDKFDGKLYASYYDRHVNQMFFVRNHDLANDTLKAFYKPTKQKEAEDGQAKKAVDSLGLKPLGTGHCGRSYKEPETTPQELFKNNSHASNEIIKKMTEMWTAIVGEGRGQIELKGEIIPFLKKAFTDKFNRCLQKWKEYCISIARSMFLMGEKTSFKATLDWALKFESIRKVLSGDYYGIGDRKRKLTPEELVEQEKEQKEKQNDKDLAHQRSRQILEEEIMNRMDEPEVIRNFRIQWLRTFGEQSYRQFLGDAVLKVGSRETDLVIQPKERYTAAEIKNRWNPKILSGQPFKRVQIYHLTPNFKGEPLVFDYWLGDQKQEEEVWWFDKDLACLELEEVPTGLDGISKETPIDIPGLSGNMPDVETLHHPEEMTQLLRHQLDDAPRKVLPSWLLEIEVEEITLEGTAIVSFKDDLSVKCCRLNHSGDIFRALHGYWPHVKNLGIRNKLDGVPQNQAMAMPASQLTGHEGTGTGDKTLFVSLRDMLGEALGIKRAIII